MHGTAKHVASVLPYVIVAGSYVKRERFGALFIFPIANCNWHKGIKHFSRTKAAKMQRENRVQLFAYPRHCKESCGADFCSFGQ